MMRRIAAGLLLAGILLAATACGRIPATLYESEQLKIDRDGSVITVQEKEAGTVHTLRAKRERRRTGTATVIKTLTDTPTVTIQAGGGLLIVEYKATGETVYISRKHR